MKKIIEKFFEKSKKSFSNVIEIRFFLKKFFEKCLDKN